MTYKDPKEMQAQAVAPYTIEDLRHAMNELAHHEKEYSEYKRLAAMKRDEADSFDKQAEKARPNYEAALAHVKKVAAKLEK